QRTGQVFEWNVTRGSDDDSADVACLAETIAGYRIDDQGAVVAVDNHVRQIREWRKGTMCTGDASGFWARVIRFFRGPSKLAYDVGERLLEEPSTHQNSPSLVPP